MNPVTINELSLSSLKKILNIDDASVLLFQEHFPHEYELVFINIRASEILRMVEKHASFVDVFSFTEQEKAVCDEALDHDGFFHTRTEIKQDNDNVIIDLKLVRMLIKDNAPYLIGYISTVSRAVENEAPSRFDRLANRSLYLHTPNPLFLLNDKGIVVRTNPAALRLLHYKEDEVLGEHFSTFIQPVDHPKTKEVFEHVSKGKIEIIDVTGRTKNGHDRYLQIRIIPIQDEGMIIGIAGFIKDMTKEMEMQKLLRHSQIQYDSVFSNNIDTMASFDREGRFLELNDATVDLVGYTREELVGQTFDFLIAEDYLEQTRACFEESFSGEPIGYETVLRVKGGKKITVYITLIPIMIEGELKRINCIAKDMTEKNQLNEKLHFLAFHDHLTGLKNQVALIHDLEDLLRSFPNEAHALLFIDLDRFKLINDALGHTKGDQLLRMIGKRLRAVVSSDISIYRYGGDEFIIVFPHVTPEKIKDFSDTLLVTMKEPYTLDRIDVVNTPSIGISLYPNDALSPDQLIKKADQAMYHAKREGKNNVQFYQENIKIDGEAVLETEALLRKAIKKKEFILHFQPQIDVETGALFGVEALIRWDRDGKIVPPNDFIPLAEETGLIIPIGEWVFRESARAINYWMSKGIDPIPVSVNLSIRQFYQTGLIDMIKLILEEEHIKPEWMTIEITESMAMDAEIALPILNEIKALGLDISIDDFGTGYSSLSYLKKFPIDFLKIDQSFVRDMLADPDDRDIIESIIVLGHRLKKRLVAEGVETKEHTVLLKSLGCDLFQGYHFSKPVDRHGIVDYIQKNY